MGKLLILAGPSCSGKTSIKNHLIHLFPIKYKSLITCTTREKRKGEQNGKDYWFVTPDEFNWKIYQNDFIEHNEYAGMKYGVLKESLQQIKDNYWFSICVMDLNGTKKMIDYLGKESVTSIYIEISEETMRKRLKERGLSVEETNNRVQKAIEEEMTNEYKSQFDYIVNNENKKIDVSVFEIVNLLVDKK